MRDKNVKTLKCYYFNDKEHKKLNSCVEKTSRKKIIMSSYIIYCLIITITSAFIIQNNHKIKIISKETIHEIVLDDFDVADSLDWRQKGVIFPAYNQVF
jgi:hypothetical protein